MKTREKLLFAWGDVFGGGAGSLVAVLYLIFLTDIAGLNPAVAALAIMLSKVVDAVADPLMGIVSDNTRTGFGRRRPYILAGGLALLAIFPFMWLPTGGWSSELAKTVFALSTFLFYSLVFTVISVPYSSLSAEISTDIAERNGVNLLRLVVSTAASALCTLLPTAILESLKAGRITIGAFYLFIGVGFGLFFALPLVLIGFFTRERARLPEEKSVFHIRTFARPLEVKAFRGLLALYLCQAISMDILSAGVVYYSLYVAKASSTILLGIFVGVQLLMFPLINSLLPKVDKRRIYYYGLPLAIPSFVCVGAYPASWPVAGIYLLTGLTAIGFAGAQVMSWIIFPDVVDAGELQLGERPTGSFSGIMTFFRKSASAIAIMVFGLMLSATGYVKPSPAIQIPRQPLSALLGIRIGMCGSFALLMALAYAAARRFVLTNGRSAEVRKFLKLREEGGMAGADPALAAQLSRLLAELSPARASRRR